MNPEVTVIVVARSLWAMTLKCLEGMIFTADLPWRLFFYSNGSEDETERQYAKIAPTWAWQHLCGQDSHHRTRPWSLSAAWNDAFKRAHKEVSTPFTVFANNDIEFYQPGWMSALINALSSGAGLVGIQEMTWHRFRFVEGSLFAARTSNLEKLAEDGRVFDTQFQLSCEDVDLSERFLRAGMHISQVHGLQPEKLVHIGHQTLNHFAPREDLQAKMHEARRRLCRKYGYDPKVED